MKLLKLFFVMLVLAFASCSDLEGPVDDIQGLVIEEEKIVSRTWEIEYFGNGPSTPTGFQNAFMALNDDNTFDIINADKEIFSGEWALSNAKDLLVIQSDGKIPAPYDEIENEWVFTLIENDQILLRERDGQGGEEIRLNTPLNSDIPRVCENLVSLVVEKSWKIERILAANVDRTSNLEGYEFSFTSAEEVVIKNQDNRFVGKWDGGIRCDKLNLDFGSVAALNDISGFWVLNYITENEIKLERNAAGELWEIKLAFNKAPSSDFCQEVEEIIVKGAWKVDKFLIGNENLSTSINEFKVEFASQGNLILHSDDRKTEGSWSLSSNCEMLPVRIDDPAFTNLLSENWRILVVTKTLLTLVSENDNVKKEIKLSRESSQQVDSCIYLQQAAEKMLFWGVEKYVFDDTDKTESFQDMSFQFLADNKFLVHHENEIIESTWAMQDECKKIEIDGGQSTVAEQISYSWYLTKISLEKMILIYEAGDRRIEMHLISKS